MLNLLLSAFSRKWLTVPPAGKQCFRRRSCCSSSGSQQVLLTMPQFTGLGLHPARESKLQLCAHHPGSPLSTVWKR